MNLDFMLLGIDLYISYYCIRIKNFNHLCFLLQGFIQKIDQDECKRRNYRF